MPTYDEYMKMLNDEVAFQQPSISRNPSTPLNQMSASEIAGSVGNAVMSPLRTLQHAGGYALTKTLAGVSSIGQGITGFFRTLEDDKAMYDQLFGQQADGTYDNRAGRFHWDKLGELFSNAARGGLSQAQRVASSDNLTELGQNSTSYSEVLKKLPGRLGDAFNVDDTRTKIGTATLGFMLDVLLDPAGMAGKVGAAEKVLANGQRVTTGGKLFGSTIIGSTGIRNQLAKRGVEEIGLYATGGGIAKGIAKAVGVGEKGQDIARRVGGNLALGNPFGAAVVVPARSLVDKSLSIAKRVAQDSNHRYFKQANSLLDWVVGPTASATDQAATTFVKGIALSEELPRIINTAAQAQQTMLSRVKGNANKFQASTLFNELVVADAEARKPILDKLEKLGINADDAQSVADNYQRGVLSAVDVLKDAGHADLVERIGINPQHIPLMYRINMGGKIEADQLTYLQQINTPASWELRQGGNLRQRLTTLMTGGAPNSAEFFSLVSGTGFTLAERGRLPGVRGTTNADFPKNKMFPDVANNGTSTPEKNFMSADAAVKSTGKLVPVSLLVNDSGKITEKKLAEFGITTNNTRDKVLRPSPLSNTQGIRTFTPPDSVAVTVGKLPPTAVEPAVGKLDEALNASITGFDEPTRLAKGFSRVHIRNADDVEQAKAALMQVRKEAISGIDFADGASARASLADIADTTGNSIAVDARGYLYTVNAKGEKVGMFVRTNNHNGGVTLVNPHAYEGMADEFANADPQGNVFNGFLRDGGMVNEEAILDPGQTARQANADNYPELSDFGHPTVSKTAFEVPAIPGINNPGVKLPSTFPNNYGVTDAAKAGLKQRVGVKDSTVNTFANTAGQLPASTARKDFAPIGFQNQAVKPNGNPAVRGFDKANQVKQMPTAARVLSDADMEDFFGALGEFVDGMRDKGNNVLGRYHELTNGGKITTRLEDGTEVTKTVNAQEYWQHLRETTKQKTITDLIDFAHNWGASKNIPKEVRSFVGQHLAQALTYVPGSREFSMGVKALRQGDGAFDELQKYFGDAWTEVGGRGGAAFDQVKLDPVYHNLYGKVDDFAVRAMGEADKLSETTAKTIIVDEMKKAGIMSENPFPGAVNMRERIGPEEAKILGIEGELQKDWWISPGNLSAYQNAFNAVKLGGSVERALQPMANQFRRAALITDPSAHVTQFLGNLAMMTHMGYGPLFEDPRKLVSGFKRTFNSVLLMDDHYQDMVKSGLQITMSPLSEGQRQVLAERVLLRADSRAETFRDVAEQMHSTWTTIMHKGQDKYNGLVEGVEDKLTQAITPKIGDYVEARQVQQAVKPGAMFAMHDMMTRAYVWDQVYRHETQQLVEANPWLTHFIGKNGLVSDALKVEDEATFTATLKQLGGEQLAKEVSLDDAKMMLGELQAARNKAAQIGNEVALNYFEVPRALRVLTQTGVVPFMKFQWKAMGRFMEWMDERPFQFAPYYKATTNANAAFSDKPEDWIQNQQALPQNVRNAMVIPLGTKDQLGRDEFIDISRWVPFGMFAGTGGGAVSPDGTPLPNQLVTAPIVDLLMSAKTGQDADGNPFFPDGQSKLGALAEKLALMFSPSGVGPGGRRAQQLANAMEQSKFVVDENGQPMFNNPVMNIGAAWGRLPQNIATEIGQMFGDQGNATALRKTPDVVNPWTTPTQAMTRAVVPGYAYSADPTKAYGQIEKAFDGRINDLKRKQSSIVNSMSYQLQPEKFAGQLNDIGLQMQKLDEQKNIQLSRLVLGE